MIAIHSEEFRERGFTKIERAGDYFGAAIGRIYLVAKKAGEAIKLHGARLGNRSIVSDDIDAIEKIRHVHTISEFLQVAQTEAERWEGIHDETREQLYRIADAPEGKNIDALVEKTRGEIAARCKDPILRGRAEFELEGAIESYKNRTGAAYIAGNREGAFMKRGSQYDNGTS